MPGSEPLRLRLFSSLPLLSSLPARDLPRSRRATVRGKISFAMLSMAALLAMLLLPITAETGRAETSVKSESSLMSTQGDLVQTAQNLRQPGGTNESTCTSSDGKKTCTCSNMCVAYAADCKCFGATPSGQGSDTAPSGPQQLKN
jgi:hypothetical protein